MEKINLNINDKIITYCKYVFASSLLLVLTSSCEENTLRSKQNDNKKYSFNGDTSLVLGNNLSCDITSPNVIAHTYIKEGKYNEAIQILLEYKDSLLKTSDTNPILIDVYNNLGNLYNCIKKNESSIDYYFKAIDISKKSGNNRSLLSNLNDLAAVYLSDGNYDESINLLLQADSILQKFQLGDNSYLSYFVYINLSNCYVEKKDFNSAKPYFLKAKNVVNGDNNIFSSYEKIIVLTCEADFFILDKNYKEAFAAYNKALFLSKESNNIELEEWILGAMKELSLSLKRYDLAYDYQGQEIDVYKEVTSIEKEKERADIETKYGVLEKEREIERQTAEIIIQKQKTKTSRVFGGGALLLALGAIGAGAILKKKNQTIALQNTELEQVNEEVRAINDELSEKNEIIEKSNREITSSINYASKIQSSLLFNDIQKYFARPFVFYRARDIVSGDFYFSAENKDGKKMLAVGDCTGHGVPGALLTIFGNVNIKQFLESADQPSDIINSLDCSFMDLYVQDVQKDNTMHDSMDIACVFHDTKTNIMEYSVSSRPILILRQGELIKLVTSGVRADVGSLTKSKNFDGYKTQKFQLMPGDDVFIFSDGMSDQFITKTDKKLGTSAFQNLLKKLGNLPVSDRTSYVERFYNDIMADNGSIKGLQTDDMLLVGFKV